MNSAQTLQRLKCHDDWQLLRQSPSPFQADIFAASIDGNRFLIKDFSRRCWLLRLCGVRLLCRHEHKVMLELLDIAGIPRVFGFLNADTLVMEFIDGQGTLPCIKELAKDAYPPLFFFMQLERIVEDMHARGIAHGDIRRRNILITDNGPALIDFGTGIRQKGPCQFVRRRIFRLCARIDERKVLQLRATYYPESLTEDEIEMLRRVPYLLYVGRLVRKHLYRRWIKRKTWQRRFYRISLWLPRRFHMKAPESVYASCENDSSQEKGKYDA